ncbi:MAG: hypothetical protein ACRENZ_11225 [Thermodesulfobacteriota bacterium]
MVKHAILDLSPRWAPFSFAASSVANSLLALCFFEASFEPPRRYAHALRLASSFLTTELPSSSAIVFISSIVD